MKIDIDLDTFATAVAAMDTLKSHFGQDDPGFQLRYERAIAQMRSAWSRAIAAIETVEECEQLLKNGDLNDLL